VNRTTHLILFGAFVMALLLTMACGHIGFPVAEGSCPFVAQGGYGMQHVLDAGDPECKIRCLQELSNACHLYGPTPQ
jgi:hypothetical protein